MNSRGSSPDSAKPAGFTEGSIRGHIARLAGVMIFGFLAMTLGQLVEVFYLGMVGRLELAAIAFSFPITMALNAMTRGIGIGASTLIARFMGMGDRQAAALLGSHCYILVLMFTVTLSLLGQFVAPSVFRLLGAKGEVLDLVIGYMHIWLMGFPLMGMVMASTGLIRSFGDVAFPGYIMTTAPVVQVLLGPFLIFGLLGFPALGLEGAALTFMAGAFCQCLVAGYWFVIRERLLRRTLQGIGESVTSILQVGIPAAATNMIQPLSAAVVTWLLAGFGVSVVAGFGVASRIESVVGMVVIGICTSVVPLVGQNWGARKFQRVDEALRTCRRAVMAWGVLAATIMWIGAPWFVSFFSGDAQVIETAVLYLYIIPISIGFMGVIQVSTHCFNALRKPVPGLMLSIARLLVVYIPLALLGRSLFGFIGVFAATAATNVIVGLISVVWNRRVLVRERNLVLTARPSS